MRKRTVTALEHIRRTRTLNQAQVADVLGISQQHYSKVERGLLPATPAIRARLCALLGKQEDELFPSAQPESLAS